MRLTELEPIFLRVAERGERAVFKHVSTIEEAHGLRFLCPKCYQANGGPKGTHSVICWTPQAPLDDKSAGGARWPMSGTGYLDLTLTPSIQLLGGCHWHGFITNGEATSV